MMQKLRKADPETLVLNFGQLSKEGREIDSDVDLDVYANVKEDDSDSSFKTNESAMAQEKTKLNVFVFAAYVPPGKHLVVVRDVGTDANFDIAPADTKVKIQHMQTSDNSENAVKLVSGLGKFANNLTSFRSTILKPFGSVNHNLEQEESNNR